MNKTFVLGALLLFCGLLATITLIGAAVPATNPIYWIACAMQLVGAVAAACSIDR